MKFDTKQEGLRTLFKPYQALLMEHIWDLNGARRKLTERPDVLLSTFRVYGIAASV